MKKALVFSQQVVRIFVMAFSGWLVLNRVTQTGCHACAAKAKKSELPLGATFSECDDAEAEFAGFAIVADWTTKVVPLIQAVLKVGKRRANRSGAGKGIANRPSFARLPT